MGHEPGRLCVALCSPDSLPGDPMVTFLSFALAAILLTAVFGAGWFLGLRTRSRKQTSVDDTKSQEAPSVIAAYDDNMEIPAALVGERCKEAIERFAPL